MPPCYLCGYYGFWHERAAFQRSAFGWSNAGNDVVATIIISLFFFSRFFPIFTVFFHSARIKKLILRKLLRTPKNLGVDNFPDPVGHFGAPWRQFRILQAVSECPLRRQADIFLSVLKYEHRLYFSKMPEHTFSGMGGLKIFKIRI